VANAGRQTEHGPDAAETRELREMLSTVYTPEGVEVWLAHAEKQGWTLAYQLERAQQLVTGAFA
jgi:hypothetical protein